LGLLFLGSRDTSIYKYAMKKFDINGQMRNESFLIFIYRSSLVKAAIF
jgi:hypothetical protein